MREREEDKFRLIQQRAYELYKQRDPHQGTAEEDWHRAEMEIAGAELAPSSHIGPARLKEKAHWGAIGTHAGEDIENPA